jgi:hypothetical protein
MRFKTLALVCAAALLSVSAQAQSWIDFRSDAWGVSINFPHEPRSEKIEYTTYWGTKVPGRVFSADRGTGRYALTVVSFSGEPEDAHTAIAHAAEAILAKGQQTYYAYANLDGIPGQLVHVTQADGRKIQASIYFVDQKLYIAEGSIGPNNPAPSQFAQSINIFGPEGDRIILDDAYETM